MAFREAELAMKASGAHWAVAIFTALQVALAAEAQDAALQPAAKADTKPAPQANAAPAPAKPKPAPKINPFQGFAKAVAIPELAQTAAGSATQVLEPITLGPCKVDEAASITANLKGGGTIFRGGKQSFTLQPAGSDPTRAWEFQYANGQTSTSIATLNAKGGMLEFQWTEAGAKQAATSRLLCNCAVEITASGFQHVFNLRQPANGPPLPISIDKGGGTARWVFDHVPDIKLVFIEATRFDGLRRRSVDVPEPVNPGGDLTVWTGPRDDSQFLGLKFESSPMAKGVKMTVSVELRSEANDRSVPYNKKEMTRFHDKLNQERAVLDRQLQEATVAKVPDRQKQEEVKKYLKQEIDARAKRLGQLDALNKYVADVQGAVAIHFRVYYQADDHQVDMFIAGDPPPRTPQRPAAPAKAVEAKK